MNYNNFGYNGYNFNPYPQQNYSFQQKQTVVRVNGKNGVDAFQMPPDSSALLLDTNLPVVWFVQTDGAGYKTSTPYKIEPYQPEQNNDVSSLEKRIARLESLIDGKSNNRPVEQFTAVNSNTAAITES